MNYRTYRRHCSFIRFVEHLSALQVGFFYEDTLANEAKQ